MKLLIDECLHTSLVELAHAADHAADHVNYLGLGGLKDWQLMGTIRQQDYTFVTNNRSDFLVLRGREPLHAGVIIIVPSVTPLFVSGSSSARRSNISAHGISPILALRSNMKKPGSYVLSTPYQKRANDMRKEASGECKRSLEC